MNTRLSFSALIAVLLFVLFTVVSGHSAGAAETGHAAAIRAGNRLPPKDRIEICHETKEERHIPSVALEAHLKHGDWLGSCGPVIQDASVVDDPIYYPTYGDLWMPTWTDDDRLLLSWGDGTGQDTGYPKGYPAYQSPSPITITSCGQFETFCQLWCNLHTCSAAHSYPPAALTDAGVLVATGTPDSFSTLSNVAIDVPSGQPFFLDGPGGPGITGNNDKPSSMLFIDGRLYFAGHYPAGDATNGYIAYSDDYGQTWTEVPGSPWGPTSYFRVVMFINMGQNYTLNTDGFVYALGIGSEGWLGQVVHLARVPVDSISDYSAYEYYTGTKHNRPRWSPDEMDARPLDNLITEFQGSAIYHEDIGRYLFMTASSLKPPGGAGALYEAPHPWGPWTKVATLCFDYGCYDGTYNIEWIDGKYIPGLIPKGTGPNHIYFTIAGGDPHYQLQVGRLDLDTGQ